MTTSHHSMSRARGLTAAVLACCSMAELTPPLRAECGSSALPGTPAAGARFGKSLAAAGDFLIVGAPQDRNAASEVRGAVYLYRRVATSWVFETRFEGNSTLGVLGDTVAVSANGLAAAGLPSSVYFQVPGVVRTYVRNAGSGTWSAANSPSGGGSYADYPSALAMNGNDLMIGCAIFAFSGDGDFEYRRYNAGTNNFDFAALPGGPHLGSIGSIALGSTTCVLGYPGISYPGQIAIVLTRTSPASNNWYSGPSATLVAGEPDSVTQDFGRAVAYATAPAERVFVGAPRADAPADESGAVYVFKKTGGAWALEQKLTSPLAGALTHFGASLAVSGSTLLVGQPDTAGGAGRVFVFDLFASAPFWRYSNALVGDGLTSTSAAFGSSVALLGALGVVGAPGEASNVGAARSIDDVHCQITGFCFGDGSGTACPCGNNTAFGAGRGCLNSFGTGARLAATGTPRVTLDTLQLQLTDTSPTGQAPTFFQGTLATANGLGALFGDGLRCASGTLLRLGTRPSINGAVSFGFGVPGDPLVSVQGAIPAAGATRFYQANYRNAVAFCTSATLNTSNGLRVTWSP